MSDDPLAGGPAARSELGAAEAAQHANSHAEWLPPPSPDVPARVRVAGAVGGFWVDPRGEVQLSIDLTKAEPWLLASDGSVSLRVLTPEGQTLFAARLDLTAAEDTDTGYAEVLPLHSKRQFAGGPAARSELGAAEAAQHANSHAEWLFPPSPDVPARVRVAGAVGGFWVDPRGEVQLSIDLTKAEPWLLASDGSVSLRVLTPEGQTLFAARLDLTAAEDTDTGYAEVLPLHSKRQFAG
jgi:hypothetical protein